MDSTIVKSLKYILTPVLAALLMSFTGSIDEIVSAIKLGDAYRISRYFDATVEISLNDRTHAYSKSQAEMILRDFFNKGVKTFQVVHRGNSNDSEYCVGSLTTPDGKYRTTIFMKIKGDKKLIQEMRFEGAP
jgi:hypothetical protein